MQYSEIEELIQDDIKQLNNILTTRLSSDVVLINQISNYIINSGGKRIRPIIVLLLCNAMDYSADNKYLMAAVIELIHTATLLHDDVVDESDMRRGDITTNEKWGNAPAVLVGDFLYSRAFEIMVEPNSMDIMQVMSKATNKIAEGEVLQLLNCGKIELTEDEYFKIIERKTACLFEASSQVAGILANNNHLESLVNFGKNLGNAFQIIDDILDYKSNSKTMGKEIGDDLAEGKITLPVIYAINNSAEKNYLIKVIKNKDISKIDIFIKILDNIKAFDYAFEKAKECANKAKLNISFLPASIYKNALIDLCDLSLDRKS